MHLLCILGFQQTHDTPFVKDELVVGQHGYRKGLVQVFLGFVPCRNLLIQFLPGSAGLTPLFKFAGLTS